MSTIPNITVKRREKLGKGESGRLKREGLIPSVVYGMGEDPFSITVHPKILNKIINSEKGLNTVISLSLEGTEQSRYVMIKDLDRHPVTDRLTHLDFVRIDMEKPVSVMIPLTFTGMAAGVKLGGVMTIVRHEIGIDCLPKDLLGSIEIDVTNLGMDQAIRVKDLPAIEGVTYQLDGERVITVIHKSDQEAPKDEEEEA